MFVASKHIRPEPISVQKMIDQQFGEFFSTDIGRIICAVQGGQLVV
jgi:hypothetical protein